MMSTFENMTDAQRERLARIAASHGTTPERVLAAAARRDAALRDASQGIASRRRTAGKRISTGFHIGESTGGYRRSR